MYIKINIAIDPDKIKGKCKRWVVCKRFKRLRKYIIKSYTLGHSSIYSFTEKIEPGCILIGSSHFKYKELINTIPSYELELYLPEDKFEKSYAIAEINICTSILSMYGFIVSRYPDEQGTVIEDNSTQENNHDDYTNCGKFKITLDKFIDPEKLFNLIELLSTPMSLCKLVESSKANTIAQVIINESIGVNSFNVIYYISSNWEFITPEELIHIREDMVYKELGVRITGIEQI